MLKDSSVVLGQDANGVGDLRDNVFHDHSARFDAALFDKMILDAVSAAMEPSPRRADARGMVHRSGKRPEAANAVAGSIARK